MGNLGAADGMYLSKPVMMRPSTSVTTRNDTVQSVIVQHTHARDLQGIHGRVEKRTCCGERRRGEERGAVVLAALESS